jgi:ABC-type branched-subunit amino acid transport system ATPase component
MTQLDQVAAPALRAAAVTVRFGGLTALSEVDLAVPRGGSVGLVGPNGAGKTTLFGVLSGLLRPTGGAVYMDGTEVTGESPQRRARRGLARTFQRIELFWELTVREHLVLAHRARHHPNRFWADLVGAGLRSDAAEAEAVGQMLDLLGLTDVADRVVAGLPLGTGRLVEVGRALANDPTVLLLDEPSSGLDRQETAALSDALVRTCRDRGVAMVLVEHDLDFVLGVSDQVTVLDFGEVLAVGPPSTIRADPEVQAAFLGGDVGAA